ncbi:MAG: 16S rRNA (guanine(966)-N(2))-methyltransferase RsmD [Oscillospiraceae bacterium]|jgi:16S rRNA (guanine(966)-N(2))-methyltransferase RsmD|nr:16S rRNA (guanine(966)-N(2))-methyltransferase RsmD [Oscillospiraceae bacterium]
MRVISGDFRGRRLEAPKSFDVRPTSDKVKESVFNIIQFQIAGARVLDLFSGTGQLGLETLSRGAAECVFVDSSQESIAIARRNIELCGAGGAARTVRADALEYIGRAEPFDIILIDPPYDTDFIEKCLRRIIEFDILKDSGIIVCESRDELKMPETEPPYRKQREYRYGKIKITIYTKEAVL